MKRTCEAGCGRVLEGRPDKRYCSEACSKRARRSGASGLADGLPSPDATSDTPGATTAAVRAELEAASRADTYLGAAALALAAQIDGATSSMGFAALVKELRATMEAAVAGAQKAVDPVDELRSRRDRKYSAG